MDETALQTIEREEVMDMFSGLDMGGDDKGKGGDPTPSPDNVIPDDKGVSDPSLEKGGSVTSDEDTKVAPKSEAQADTDWEKRFKDTQRSFNEEHQKRLDLEARIRAIETAQTAGQTTKQENAEVADILKTFKDKWDDDPEEALTSVLSSLDSKINQINQASQQRELQRDQQSYDQQEADARKKFEDYDKFVDDEFITELQTSAQLNKLWRDNGANAEGAYELARKHKAHIEYLKTGTMPDWAKPPESKQADPKDTKEPQSLSDIPAAPAPPASPRNGRRLDSVADLEAALFLD